MRFSIWPSTGRPWGEILELARHFEAAGWDGLYLADHFMLHGDLTDPQADQSVPLDGDKLECWSVLAALAATVPRLRLGTLVSSVTFRHPAVLANMAAAVDNISDGRLVLGIGAGWQLNEHVAYGLELGSPKERLDRFEEACQVITSLLRERRTTYAGTYFTVTDAPNQPAPVQTPLPLLIGGGGEKRTLRLVARYADEWNIWSTPEVLAQKLGVLREHCEAIGRDPATIAPSTQMAGLLARPTSEVQETVGRFRDAGAAELVIPDPMVPMKEWRDMCDEFLEQVAADFR